jgi:hypothetical protein
MTQNDEYLSKTRGSNIAKYRKLQDLTSAQLAEILDTVIQQQA